MDTDGSGVASAVASAVTRQRSNRRGRRRLIGVASAVVLLVGGLGAATVGSGGAAAATPVQIDVSHSFAAGTSATFDVVCPSLSGSVSARFTLTGDGFRTFDLADRPSGDCTLTAIAGLPSVRNEFYFRVNSRCQDYSAAGEQLLGDGAASARVVLHSCVSSPTGLNIVRVPAGADPAPEVGITYEPTGASGTVTRNLTSCTVARQSCTFDVSRIDIPGVVAGAPTAISGFEFVVNGPQTVVTPLPGTVTLVSGASGLGVLKLRPTAPATTVPATTVPATTVPATTVPATAIQREFSFDMAPGTSATFRLECPSPSGTITVPISATSSGVQTITLADTPSGDCTLTGLSGLPSPRNEFYFQITPRCGGAPAFPGNTRVIGSGGSVSTSVSLTSCATTPNGLNIIRIPVGPGPLQLPLRYEPTGAEGTAGVTESSCTIGVGTRGVIRSCFLSVTRLTVPGVLDGDPSNISGFEIVKSGFENSVQPLPASVFLSPNTVASGAVLYATLSIRPVASAGLTLNLPPQVAVGQSFQAVVSGAAPGSYVELVVDGSSQGGALADSAGVARITTALYRQGTLPVVATETTYRNGTPSKRSVTGTVTVGNATVTTVAPPTTVVPPTTVTPPTTVRPPTTPAPTTVVPTTTPTTGPPTTPGPTRTTVPTGLTVAFPSPVAVGQTLTFVVTGAVPGSYVDLTVGGSSQGGAFADSSGTARIQTALYQPGSLAVVVTETTYRNGSPQTRTRTATIVVGSSAPTTASPTTTPPTTAPPTTAPPTTLPNSDFTCDGGSIGRTRVTLNVSPNPATPTNVPSIEVFLGSCVINSRGNPTIVAIAGERPVSISVSGPRSASLGTFTTFGPALVSDFWRTAPAGTYTVTATYSGTATVPGASGQASVVLNVGTTTVPPTTVASGLRLAFPSPVNAGQTFAVTVTGAAPGSYVDLTVGGSSQGGAIADASGTARISTAVYRSGSLPLVVSETTYRNGTPVQRSASGTLVVR